MNISIASYSFHGLKARGMIDVFGYLEASKFRYRLDTADIWNGIIGDDPEVYLQETFLSGLRSALREREMTLANYHVDGVHVWEDDPAARERNRQNALRHLKAAAFLGAKTVRIDMGGKGLDLTVEQMDTVVRTYQEFARFAGDSGFRVGPETHWGPSLNPDVMEAVARAVDSPHYGILLHLGHWEKGDPEENDRRLAPWACHTHVDATITRHHLEERIRLMLEAGYTGCWGVEHHSARNEYAEVEYQVAEVRRVLSRLQAEMS